MSAVHGSMLEGIGPTPLLALRHVVAENGARLHLELEALNPTGSMQDGMALAILEAAELSHRPHHRS